MRINLTANVIQSSFFDVSADTRMTLALEGTVSRSPNGNVPSATLGAELPLRRNSQRFNSPTVVSRDHASDNCRRSNTDSPNYCAISSDDERTAGKRKSSSRTTRHRSRSLSPYSSEKEKEVSTMTEFMFYTAPASSKVSHVPHLFMDANNIDVVIDVSERIIT